LLKNVLFLHFSIRTFYTGDLGGKDFFWKNLEIINTKWGA
jgi:hypothetical protein